VPTFDFAVRLRVIRRCPDVRHTRNADELLEVLGDKMWSVVRNDPRLNPRVPLFGTGPDRSPMAEPNGKGVYFVSGRTAGTLTLYRFASKQFTSIVEEIRPSRSFPLIVILFPISRPRSSLAKMICGWLILPATSE
jgi:hypothetical protein